MGQTSSHKHLRTDFAKGGPGSHSGQQHGGIMRNSGYGSSADYNFNPEDINEDDEISYPTINSRHSYVRTPTYQSPFSILIFVYIYIYTYMYYYNDLLEPNTCNTDV